MKTIDGTYTYQEAKAILLKLKANGVEVSEALKEIKPRRMWRLFYSPAMTKPSVTRWNW